MVRILYTSSDHPLYLYQVFKWTQKIYKGEYFYDKRKSNGSFFCTCSDNILYFMKFSKNPFYVL